MNTFQRLLTAFSTNQGAVALYANAVQDLRECTMIRMLRELGRPKRIAFGTDVQVMASEGSYSAGWNDCLDFLEHFSQQFLEDNVVKDAPRMDYGSLTAGVLRGDLMIEEADAIKRGDKPEYDISKFTGLKPPSKQ